MPHVAVPVRPLIAKDAPPFALFVDYKKYQWTLPLYRYDSMEGLIESLTQKVIEPAEAKIVELRKMRLATDDSDN